MFHLCEPIRSAGRVLLLAPRVVMSTMILKAMAVIMHRNDVQRTFNKLKAMGGSKSMINELDSSSSITASFNDELACLRDLHATARNVKW